MRLSIVKYCFWFLLTIPVLLSAQSGKKERKGSLNGYMKTLQSASVIRLPNPVSGGFESAILSNNLLHNRLNYSRPLGDKIRFNASLRNRFFYGDIGVEEVLLKQLNQGNDYFDLSLETVQNNYAAQTILDRFYADIYFGDWEISIGRQRINWGISSFWNSNDIFNAFNFTDFDYEERPGSDAFLLRRYIGETGSIEFAISAADKKETLKTGLLWKFNLKNYDYQALLGLYNQYLTAGGGWSGAIGPVGFKGEFNTFSPINADNTFASSASFELDYINQKATYFGLGFLYNSLGSTDGSILSLFNFEISARNLYPYQYTSFLSINQSFSPIFSGGLSFIYSPGEAHATFLSPNFNLSIAQNWDLAFFGQFVLEKSEKYSSPLMGFFLRLKYSF